MGKAFKQSAQQQRASAEYIAGQAAQCAELWRAVIVQLALDVEPTWGLSDAERREALMFFEGRDRSAARWREELCSLAMIDPDALLTAYAAGELKTLSRDAIGKRRYETRRRNRLSRTIEQFKLGEQMELSI